MKPSREISRLLEIMAALRTPVTGCPWDLEQDFASIVPYTIEEAYEVADAIERTDMNDLREELGDLLLQVVYHAQMATEAGHFTFEDVVETVTAKMIRRHPHVFGDETARSAGMAKGMWEKIKAQEKAERIEQGRASSFAQEEPQAGYLDGIPNTFPALPRALKLQEKAARVGFDWAEAASILDKIEEEITELRAAMANASKAEMTDELGDLLFALVNLGRHLRVDPEMALRGTNAKFIKRFSYVEECLQTQGRSLEEASLEEMEALWQAAKAQP
jgi:nucleoside triphosphate diphosphatase